MSPREFDLAKMTLAESQRARGLGRLLLAHTIGAARALGARRLYLETDHGLAEAIHLYKARGFRRIPPELATPSPYARSDVAMELIFAREALA